ncbi:MAG: superoxide dismutase [Candidatus Moranbacteria bacterium]|nr:superoxide dismutase [Candidatus Moranbacteria bacterium]
MYEPQDFSRLLGASGFSDTLLSDHFKLYEGYVKNVNTVVERLKTIEPGSIEGSELRRRFGWEWNGMRLHELYFGNLTSAPEPLDPESGLAKAIVGRFGSLDGFLQDFRRAGTMRGIGWVVLAYDLPSGELFNLWINEHDGGHLSGTTPLLVMDVFEHAYLRDYGLARADYVDAFMNAVDWHTVLSRYSHAS